MVAARRWQGACSKRAKVCSHFPIYISFSSSSQAKPSDFFTFITLALSLSSKSSFLLKHSKIHLPHPCLVLLLKVGESTENWGEFGISGFLKQEEAAGKREKQEEVKVDEQSESGREHDGGRGGTTYQSGQSSKAEKSFVDFSPLSVFIGGCTVTLASALALAQPISLVSRAGEKNQLLQKSSILHQTYIPCMHIALNLLLGGGNTPSAWWSEVQCFGYKYGADWEESTNYFLLKGTSYYRSNASECSLHCSSFALMHSLFVQLMQFCALLLQNTAAPGALHPDFVTLRALGQAHVKILCTDAPVHHCTPRTWCTEFTAPGAIWCIRITAPIFHCT